MEKSSWTVASHLPGAVNVAADEESRMDRREQEWKLDSDIFHKGPFLLGVNDMMDPVCFLA